MFPILWLVYPTKSLPRNEILHTYLNSHHATIDFLLLHVKVYILNKKVFDPTIGNNNAYRRIRRAP